MKRLFLLFILLPISISVDSETKAFIILRSGRMPAPVVLNEVSGDSLCIDNSVWIRIEDIDTVRIITGSYTFWGGLIGCGVGGYLGGQAFPTKSTGHESAPPIIPRIEAVIVWVAGTVLGVYIGSKILSIESIPFTGMTHEDKIHAVRRILSTEW